MPQVDVELVETLVRRFEPYHSVVVRLPTGIAVLGWAHWQAIGHACELAEAEAWLADDIAAAAAAVLPAITVELNDKMLSVLTSWYLTVHPYKLPGLEAAFIARLNQGDYAQVVDGLLLALPQRPPLPQTIAVDANWNLVMSYMSARREAEAELWGEAMVELHPPSPPIPPPPPPEPPPPPPPPAANVPTQIQVSPAADITAAQTIAAGSELFAFALDNDAQGTGYPGWSYSAEPSGFEDKIELVDTNGPQPRLLATAAFPTVDPTTVKQVSIRYQGEGADLSAALTVTITTAQQPAGSSVFDRIAKPSGLGWLSGAQIRPQYILELRKLSDARKRVLDIAGGFSKTGNFSDYTRTYDVRLLPSGQGEPWVYWKDRGAPTMCVAHRMFCSERDSNDNGMGGKTVPGAGFTGVITQGHYVATTLPYGFVKSEGDMNVRRERVRHMFRQADAGKFDDIWRFGLQHYIDKAKATSVYDQGKWLILRPFWELNLKSSSGGSEGWGWDSEPLIRCDNLCWGKRADGDVELIRSVLRRFCGLARDLWDGRRSSDLGGFLLHYNPLSRDNCSPADYTVHDLLEAGLWDCVGPDFYDSADDTGPYPGQTGGTFEQRWNDKYGPAYNPAAPKLGGLNSWLGWVRAHPGERLGIGEWGLRWGWGNNTTMSAATYDNNIKGGGDNPLFVQKMWDFFNANADIMGYECYFTGGKQEHLLARDHSQTLLPDSSDKYAELWTSGL